MGDMTLESLYQQTLDKLSEWIDKPIESATGNDNISTRIQVLTNTLANLKAMIERDKNQSVMPANISQMPLKKS